MTADFCALRSQTSQNSEREWPRGARNSPISSCPATSLPPPSASFRKFFSGADLSPWRRPLALALVFVIVDSIFTLVYALRLSFLSTILFLCVVSNIVRFVYEFAGTGVDLWLFEAPRPPDDPNQSNRVRTPEEVDATICYWQANGRRFGEWFRNYIAEPSWGKHAMFFGAVFIVFVVAMAVGTFSIVAIIVHAILVLPGLLLNPAVRGFVSERIRRAKEVKRQAITPSAPNDRKPQNKLPR
jgi:hypothetical protein